MKRVTYLGVAFALLVVVSPQGATATSLSPSVAIASPLVPAAISPSSLEPVAGTIDLDAVNARALALREATTRGSLERVLRTSAGLSDAELAGVLTPRTTNVVLPVFGNSFGAALNELYSTVLAAEPAVRDATRGVGTRLLAEVLSIDPQDHEALERLEPRASRVDVRGMTAIAASIAAAIDSLLAAAPPARSHARAADAECDVLDLRPTLCVGGTGANTYTTDASLAIDLGGDDTYRNAGGTGACLAGSVFTPRCVSVVVDLAGNDLHAPPPWNCVSTTCGQGAGVLGVGMLVDAGGNDQYITIGGLGEPASGCVTETRWCGSVAAHGTGGLGVGVLADLAGDDVYRAAFDRSSRGPDGFEATQSVSAQGAAIFGSAVLWDAGGNDAYEMSVHSTGHLGEEDDILQGQEWTIVGGSGLLGQGVGLVGEGTLLDGGGTDRIVATARPAPDASIPNHAAPEGQGGSAGAIVQAYAEALIHDHGVGAIVTGIGDTEYTVDLEARMRSFIQAQATSRNPGATATIDDAGGNDRYALSAATDVALETRCDCAKAIAALDVIQNPFTTHYGLARPQVFGQGGPQGSLRDRGGSDVYRASARSTVEVSAVNTRPGGVARASILGVGETVVQAQGVQPGRLQDDGGDDRYVLEALRYADATARATPGANGIADEESFVVPGTVSAAGQGQAAAGAEGPLDDRGGKDVYEARFDSDGTASPGGQGREGDGIFSVFAQGADGLLSDVDVGQADAFHADSTGVFDTCVGRYGQGPGWVSGPTLRGGQCSPSWGETIATSTLPPGLDTNLSIQSVQPAGDQTWPAYEVAVKLTDASGVPLPGRRITLWPEWAVTSTDPLVNELYEWLNVTGTTQNLVTDDQGVGRGFVPTRQLICELNPDYCNGNPFFVRPEHRIHAMYFGEPGAYEPSRGTSAVMDGA